MWRLCKREHMKERQKRDNHPQASCWPRLILCFSPDRMPGVSMILILSRTGFFSWAHMNLQKETAEKRRERERMSREGGKKKCENLVEQVWWVHTRSVSITPGSHDSRQCCNKSLWISSFYTTLLHTTLRFLGVYRVGFKMAFTVDPM